MPRSNQHKNKKVYVFGLGGEPLNQYASATKCAEDLGLNRTAVTNAIKRRSVLSGKMYVSYDQKNPAKLNKNNRNPLLTNRIINQASGAGAWFDMELDMELSMAG